MRGARKHSAKSYMYSNRGGIHESTDSSEKRLHASVERRKSVAVETGLCQW